MQTLNYNKILCFAVLFCVASAVTSHAQTYSVIADFNPAYGENPSGPLVQGTDGNFYGVTETGGNTNSICPGPEGIIGAGCGSIFKVTPAGELTTLYEFCSQANCVDGAYPMGSLMLATNGNFYGTTFIGGTENQGTVFQITPSGQFTSIYSFCYFTNCTDGALPNGGLVQGANGNLYGTTQIGGGGRTANICTSSYYDPPVGGCGTVFETTLAGNLITIYDFCSIEKCPDGAVPVTGLTLGTDGMFYGTTVGGGNTTSICTEPGCGTIFRMSQSGKLTTMYRFCTLANEANPCLSGQNPQGTLVQAADGSLYGTAGTVFSITSTGKLSLIRHGRFWPAVSGIIQATDGNFYATQPSGGANTTCSEGSPCGDLIEFQSSGTFNFLYSFCAQQDCADGALPAGGLMQATNGALYGTTLFGGTGIEQGCNEHGNSGCGTVFSASVELGPFVRTIFNFGQAPNEFRILGSDVRILGNGLTGTTSVTFNGVAASFTVVSDTYIKTTVPAGATTGTIELTTPSGTLSSNVPFQVSH
jgi:uncharacterized repeat protein (TIGR03803 family)